MKYERRNNLGFGALLIGSGIVIVALFINNLIWLVISLLVGVLFLAIGGYMMTRGFTGEDVDHPDFEQYQKRFGDQESR